MIAKKYGKEAINDIFADWNEKKEKDYIRQVKEYTEKQNKLKSQSEKVKINDFYVSKKLINEDSSRDCPVCGKYSFNVQDDVYMIKYECCYQCYIKYVEGREDRWETGWRPKDEDKKG